MALAVGGRAGHRLRSLLLVALVAGGMALPPPASAAPRWHVDTGASTFVVHVRPRGLLSPTLHEIFLTPERWTGTLLFSPEQPERLQLEVVVRADSLKARQPALSAEDLEKLEQQVRGVRVLDAEHEPEIVYKADRLVVEERRPDGVRGTLQGELTLRGQTWRLPVPVDAHWDKDGLVAEGQVTFLQSDFGIEPYQRYLGTQAIEDEVEVRYHVLAHPQAE